jgi:hypothetical protein
MAVFLVTYDLKKPGQSYDRLLEYIKTHSWARLSESSYAIRTNASTDDVYERVRTFVNANDTVYVINLTRPYNGYGPNDVNTWLEENLP